MFSEGYGKSQEYRPRAGTRNPLDAKDTWSWATSQGAVLHLEIRLPHQLEGSASFPKLSIL